MARIRTIKPSFFRSEDVSALPLRARLTWIGLWTQCDDAGRTKDNARLIKGDIWPLDDVSLRDIEDDLATLAVHGRIVRYTVAGGQFLAIVNWRGHQAIAKPSASRYPPPPEVIHSDYGTTTGALPDDDGNGTAGKGKEGKGREGTRARADALPEQEPPQKCAEHQHLRNPPACGACKDARQRLDDWKTARNQRVDAAPKCRQHRGQLAHNCSLCAAERKAAS